MMFTQNLQTINSTLELFSLPGEIGPLLAKTYSFDGGVCSYTLLHLKFALWIAFLSKNCKDSEAFWGLTVEWPNARQMLGASTATGCGDGGGVVALVAGK